MSRDPSSPRKHWRGARNASHEPSPPRNPPLPGGGSHRNAIPIYEFPNQRVTNHLVKRMPLRVSALRALGATANVFAIESFMDELAAAAGADPIEFRLRHLKDPRAVEYAEKANRLAPNRPSFMDTLGMLLVERGDTKRGIELLQRAVALSPEAPAIRLNLSKALLKAGRKDEARRELRVLANLGDKYPEHAEVAELMKGL